MGQFKQLAIAVEEAMDEGMMPRPSDAPSVVWVMTCDGRPVGSYISEDTAMFDMHMCREADSMEPGELHEYAVTKTILHSEFWGGV